VRVVSKQGRATPSKPALYAEMLARAKVRFEAAGLAIDQVLTTCQNFDLAGVFMVKDNYSFTIDGQSQKAKAWRHVFAACLHEGTLGCEIPVCRVRAVSPTFGSVVLVFCRRKGERKVRMEC
jgi:hypothetical protein